MRISDWSSDVCSSDLADRCNPSVDRATELRQDLRACRGLVRCDPLCSVELIDVETVTRPGDRASRLCGSIDIGTRHLARASIHLGDEHHFGAESFEHLRSRRTRSEEHTSELQSLMRLSYAVFCLTNKNN